LISRLSELAGCIATVSKPFPTGVAGDGSNRNSDLRAALRGMAQEVRDPCLGLQLGWLLEQVQRATRQAERLAFGRSEEQLTARVRPNSWSPAECLDHLALTTSACLPSIAKAMASTPPLRTNRPLRCDPLARVLIRVLEPPYRLRHKAVGHLAPQQNNFQFVWRAFVESQQALAQVVRGGMGLAIDSVKIQSPVCSRMSYSVYGALGILSAHQRRHLWQAQQVLRTLDRQV
jgi:DinB superfamily